MAESPFVIEVNQSNFNEVVIEGSMRHPVLVDFWAAWCNPCQMLMPILAKLADEYQGKFVLAKVNSDENQSLATQFGVRSLPTVKLFKDGAVVDEFMGALPEGQIRDFLDRHIDREADLLLAAARSDLADGNLNEALATLEKANETDPGYKPVVVELAKLLIQTGHADRAEALLNDLSYDDRRAADVAGLLASIEFAREAESVPPMEALEAAVEQNPDDLDARYALAIRQVVAGEYESAMDNLLTVMKKDRKFRDDAARKTLLKIFDLRGEDPLVEQYRRKMFNFLY